MLQLPNQAEIDPWMSFEFAISTSFLHKPAKTAIVSGRYLSPKPTIVYPWMVAERFRRAIRSWQTTDSGARFVRSCGNSVSLDDLGTEIQLDLDVALVAAGLLEFKICEFEIEPGWDYDQDFTP